jgi:hypothetical protein
VAAVRKSESASRGGWTTASIEFRLVSATGAGDTPGIVKTVAGFCIDELKWMRVDRIDLGPWDRADFLPGLLD